MRQVGIFGKRKSGKSALMYALTQHKIKATFRAMEIGSVTKVMLVDTVGVDVEDSTAEKSAQSVEVALMLITDDTFELELAWISKLLVDNRRDKSSGQIYGRRLGIGGGGQRSFGIKCALCEFGDGRGH